MFQCKWFFRVQRKLVYADGWNLCARLLAVTPPIFGNAILYVGIKQYFIFACSHSHTTEGLLRQFENLVIGIIQVLIEMNFTPWWLYWTLAHCKQLLIPLLLICQSLIAVVVFCFRVFFTGEYELSIVVVCLCWTCNCRFAARQVQKQNLKNKWGDVLVCLYIFPIQPAFRAKWLWNTNHSLVN